MVGRYPDRFAGVAAVDLVRPIDAVRELRRCVRDLGFRALRVVPWLWNLPPDDRLYYPLYAECVELGIPFCLQVGHTGPLRPFEPGRPAQDPGPVPGVLPLPALPLPAADQDRDRLRQLLAPPDHRQRRPGRGMGEREQCRDRLYADEFVLVNRVEAQFTALRYFALDGTDHASHREQASMIRRYVIWRNNHAYDERLRQVVTRANVA